MELNIPKKFIGIACAAIGGLVGFYMLPNKAAETEAATNKLVSENKQLTDTEANLVNLQNNAAQFAADTEAFNKESRQILEEFPTFMFLEDKVLYADHMQKDEMAHFNLVEFHYGKSDYVMSTSYSDSSLMELYSVSCVAEFENLTYPQVKELINFGKSENSSQRFVLSNIEFAYSEETGYLVGEFSFKTYFIAGQEDPYVFDPEILELIGTDRRIDDLFGARMDVDDSGWDEEYGDMIDNVLDDIIEGDDFEIIDD